MKLTKRIKIFIFSLLLVLIFCFIGFTYKSILNSKETLKTANDVNEIYSQPSSLSLAEESNLNMNLFYEDEVSNLEEQLGTTLTELNSKAEQEKKQKDKHLLEEVKQQADKQANQIRRGAEKIQKQTKAVSKHSNEADKLVKLLIDQAESCLGTPYVWAGTSKKYGMDCSGFVQYCYKQIGYQLPRTSAEQSKKGKLVKRTELKVGDLLFFDTTNYRDSSDITTPEKECEYAEQVASGYAPNKVSHVGIYVGGSKMIHAASGSGYVRYESIESDYYKVRFMNARRIIRD